MLNCSLSCQVNFQPKMNDQTYRDPPSDVHPGHRDAVGPPGKCLHGQGIKETYVMMMMMMVMRISIAVCCKTTMNHNLTFGIDFRAHDSLLQTFSAMDQPGILKQYQRINPSEEEVGSAASCLKYPQRNTDPTPFPNSS